MMTDRAPNFSEADRLLLIELVGPHAQLINCAKKDAATNKEKAIAWNEITAKFNSNPTVTRSRTTYQLSKSWKNMANKTKKDVGAVKRSIYATGGGPQGPKLTTISANMAGILGDSLNPLDNPHDSDAGYHGDQVIKLSQPERENDIGLAVDCETTPKPLKEKFFFSRKRSNGSAVSTTATDEILQMRRELHKAKMAKIELETEYWRLKLSSEFSATNFTNE